MSNKLVKDYLGNLVPRGRARKIQGKYYVENESCFLMPDDQWYRITSTERIIYDHFRKSYVLRESSKLIEGYINSKGEKGMFSENPDAVVIKTARGYGSTIKALNEDIAKDLGYIESVSDGAFYSASSITEEDKKQWFNKKNIPQEERSKSYNVESDPDKKRNLQKAYDELKIKISPQSKRLGKYIEGFTIGTEFEVYNGFLPPRIRNKFGFKVLKDGSLRSSEGEGIEMASAVMSGAKCIEVLHKITSELTNRCEINNLCSLHFHFGNVRKDKLYVLSLYRLITMLQLELIQYFPYSRFNSIKDDGKVYCKVLPDLKIDHSKFLKASEEEIFRTSVVAEFNKIYKWLNNGKGLAEEFGEPTIQRETKVIGGKKMFATSWLRSIYTTKAIHNSVEGEKWNKLVRYHIVNFLNLFFTKLETVEFRCMEGTLNFTKSIIWLLTCASIIKYAETHMNGCLSASSVTLKQVLTSHLGAELSDYCMAYYELRHKTFFTSSNSYRESFKSIENKWFKDDLDFTFKHNNIELV